MSTRIEVVLPSLGDDDDAVAKATVSMWLANVGQSLNEGDDLLEITTDKAAFVVPAPLSGMLAVHHVAEGDVVLVGQAIAAIDAA